MRVQTDCKTSDVEPEDEDGNVRRAPAQLEPAAPDDVDLAEDDDPLDHQAVGREPDAPEHYDGADESVARLCASIVLHLEQH